MSDMLDVNTKIVTLDLTTRIVVAHITKNSVAANRLPNLIRSIFQALTTADQPEPEVTVKRPAVPVKQSIFHNHLVCLECGKNYRTLTQHLRVEHNLTKQRYRERFDLPNEYPFIAPEFAKSRSANAKRSALAQAVTKGDEEIGAGPRQKAVLDAF